MSSSECLICYNQTKSQRRNIIPYVCKCNYYIHKTCYIKWKKTGTDRLCIICHVCELPDVIDHVDIVIIHVESPCKKYFHKFLYMLLYCYVIMYTLCAYVYFNI